MDFFETDNLIERMAAARKIELRKAASRESLQLVHAEILDYLANCNRYSNTTMAVAEYLGHTKGTISQSLKLLEKKGLIARETDESDRRIARLSLTTHGKQVIHRLFKSLPCSEKDDPALVSMLRAILLTWQKSRDCSGFGLCRTCRYNIDLSDDAFQCGLTSESLKKHETEKVCREHQYPAVA